MARAGRRGGDRRQGPRDRPRSSATASEPFDDRPVVREELRGPCAEPRAEVIALLIAGGPGPRRLARRHPVPHRLAAAAPHRPADPRGRARGPHRSRRARPTMGGIAIVGRRGRRLRRRPRPQRRHLHPLRPARDGAHRRRRARRPARRLDQGHATSATSGCRKRAKIARPARRRRRLRRRSAVTFTDGAHHSCRSPASTCFGLDLGTRWGGRCGRVLLILGDHQRREPHRRPRRAGRGLGDLRVHRLHGRSASGRSATPTCTRSTHALDLAVVAAAMVGALRRVPLVERRPGADHHGRHRLARHRRRPGRPGPHDATRTAAADHRRAVRGRDAVGDHPGRQLPAVRPAGLPHGADPPPLRARRLAGDHGDHPLLDPRRPVHRARPRPLLRRLRRT